MGRTEWVDVVVNGLMHHAVWIAVVLWLMSVACWASQSAGHWVKSANLFLTFLVKTPTKSSS